MGTLICTYCDIVIAVWYFNYIHIVCCIIDRYDRRNDLVLFSSRLTYEHFENLCFINNTFTD